MGRQEGFYWVRLSDWEWEVAQWLDGSWWTAGSDSHYQDSDFAEIDERRIERTQ